MASKEEPLSLVGLLGRVKEGVESSVPFSVWLSAEINEIKQRASGHCYMELVEASSDGSVCARVQAVIWASAYRMIKPYFEGETGMPLSSGMKVLVKVQVSFSELYGLSLVISDIEPSFSVGAAEVERRRVIARLEAEGMFEMNATLGLDVLPRRIAVVSSETAAGYRDFVRHLSENQYGFRFDISLFGALMQGADAPSSIIAALDSIAGDAGAYDLVVIVRGGGSVADLRCYDDYELAVNIAQFPLPVVTGVGHDHDVHVCDMVAWKGLKTPTAVADFILDMFVSEDMRLESLATRLQMALKMRFNGLYSKLDMLEQRLASADPRRIVSRGYVLAADSKGRVFNSVSAVSKGERLSLMAGDGILECIVDDIREGSPLEDL